MVHVMSTGLESRPTEGATMYDGIWSGMGEPINDWGRFAVACVVGIIAVFLVMPKRRS